jgi:hypothetical protein
MSKGSGTEKTGQDILEPKTSQQYIQKTKEYIYLSIDLISSHLISSVYLSHYIYHYIIMHAYIIYKHQNNTKKDPVLH